MSIHHHNTQLVAIEMFKVKNGHGLSVDLISCLFEKYPNPTDQRTFIIPRVKTEYMGGVSTPVVSMYPKASITSTPLPQDLAQEHHKIYFEIYFISKDLTKYPASDHTHHPE